MGFGFDDYYSNIRGKSRMRNSLKKSRSPKKSRTRRKSPKKSRTRRKSSPKKSRSRKRSLSSGAKRWHEHLMKVYKSGKKKQGSYSLKKAMKDAKKTY